MLSYKEMRIEIMMVGRTRLPWVSEGEAYYVKRLGRYVQYASVIIPATKGSNLSQIVDMESQRILHKMHSGTRAFNILMIDTGKAYTSPEMARRIESITRSYGPAVRFIVGGAYGVSEEVRKEVDACISLSPMTFPHEMVRIVLLEQLYRAFTILRGERYHHG
jgi:23S rRNA (pseudouridine1915-N3)-methyltransferase